MGGYTRSRPGSGAATGLAQPPSSADPPQSSTAGPRHGSGKARRKLFRGELQVLLYGNSLLEPVFISEVLSPYFLCL
jgi:hypothetical protein